MRPVSEKAAEILFTRFMLQAFPLGHIELFAPSSREEFVTGYDAHFVGPDPFRQLCLQFKAPTYSEFHDRFTIRLTAHQHQLLKTYPANSAFYVAGMFCSLREFNLYQTHLRKAAFLAHFVCIEVSALPDEVDFFHVTRPSLQRLSPHVTFKVPADGPVQVATHTVTDDGWLRGHVLLEHFRGGALGGLVQPIRARSPNEQCDSLGADRELTFRESGWAPSRSQLFERSRGCTTNDFPVHIRERRSA